MLVFIDESGDAGMKLGEGSSPHFVVTLVVFKDNEIALSADHHIDEIRKMIGFRKDAEFKFNKASADIRKIFLTEISQFDFQYFSIVINKAELFGPGFQHVRSFYKYACKLVCLNAKDVLRDAIIVIDGCGSREFKRQLATYLRTNVNDKEVEHNCISKVKMEDSKKNNLIQVADMVCGAVARSHKSKPDARTYRNIIRARESYVQVWPKKKVKSI